MLTREETISKELTDVIKANIENKKLINRWASSIKEMYGIPEKMSTDYLTLRKEIYGVSPFIYYVLTDVVLPEYKLRKFFTPQEIKEFSKTKWEIEKVNFPLRYSMTRINDEQYIGCITVKDLMLLKDAQLINYNENAQRTMRHIIRGDIEYYQISLNKEAVKAIVDSYERDLYIPNTITLNLPEEADYYYDEKKKELVIKKAEYLDILDGYHRYVAMSKIHSLNPDFNYEMELRIVQFSEDKAKRFIWQEDQKTKMRKIDSDSLNTAKASNKIVSRINENSSFILAGKISRNNGIINSSDLSSVIDTTFIKGTRKSDESRLILTLTKEIINAIEKVIEDNPELMTKSWTKKHLLTLAYDIKYGNIENFATDYFYITGLDDVYTKSMMTQADMTRVIQLLGKEK